MISCPICQSQTCHKHLQIYDDRYGYPGTFDLYRCVKCKHRFLDASFSVKEIQTLYSDYYPRKNLTLADYAPATYKPSFSSWLNGTKQAFARIPPNVSILDIGCGFGEALTYHRNRGCTVYGVEADDNAQKIAEAYGFTIKIGTFEPTDYTLGSFDYVTMEQVLEHSLEPTRLLQGVNRVLKPRGHCVLTTPNSNGWNAFRYGRKWVHWHAPYHLNHFSRRSIRKLAAQTGFEVISISNVTNSEWRLYQKIHLAVFPPMGKKAPFWNAEIPLTTSQSKKVTRFAYWHRWKLNHIICRVQDFLNIGDNYVVHLRKKGI